MKATLTKTQEKERREKKREERTRRMETRDGTDVSRAVAKLQELLKRPELLDLLKPHYWIISEDETEVVFERFHGRRDGPRGYSPARFCRRYLSDTHLEGSALRLWIDGLSVAEARIRKGEWEYKWIAVDPDSYSEFVRRFEITESELAEFIEALTAS